MAYLDWRRQVSRQFGPGSGARWILGLVVVLAVLSVMGDGWRAARRAWHGPYRPVAGYQRRISNGLAISLNGLERRHEPGERLPGLELRGVLLDRARHDFRTAS